jgi:hypothetical protein
MKKRIPLGDYNDSLETAIEKATRVLARNFAEDDQPDLDSLRTVVLKQGKLVSKVAKYWGIRSRRTGEHKCNRLNLVSLRRTKERGWEFEIRRSITIDDRDKDDSIGRLFDLLASLPQIDEEGEHIVINIEDVDIVRFREILNAVSVSDRKLDLISQILAWTEEDPRAVSGLVQLASDRPKQTKSLIAALNFARLSRALDDLKSLVKEDHLESVYQGFLQEHHWMFGSEYSQLVTNRQIVRGLELDFPLRRTVDGYLDIIEIKTPLHGEPLFRKKGKRWSETSDLVDAINQADDYLANIDAEQYQIKFHEELDVEKVRAKVVIGRDGDAEQVRALRRLNARINRIEVITFDQLMKIAQRILDLLVEENPLLAEEEDVRGNSEAELPPPSNSDDNVF